MKVVQNENKTLAILDGSVGQVPGYRLDDQGSIFASGNSCLQQHYEWTGSEAPSVPHFKARSRVKQLNLEADLTLPSTADVGNVWIFTFLPEMHTQRATFHKRFTLKNDYRCVKI
jgi:hypothetical protein